MIRKFFILFVFLCASAAWSQTEQQKKLEQEKVRIQQQIKEFQNLVSKETKKERSALSQIAESNEKIKLSEKLINTTQKQTKLLTDEIYTNQLAINKLNRELEALKEDYANMIVKSYKSRSEQSRIMFILSSDNFLQAYKRLQYMKQYASFRKIQGDEIREKTQELEVLKNKLSIQKQQKERLLAETEQDRKELEKERQEQEKLVKIIQKDKRKYTADIKKKQKEAQDLDRRIKKLIQEAIAEANRKTAAATGKKTTTATAAGKIALTPETKIIADNFKANKGKLPWPVEKGYISSSFGTHAHPLTSSVTINNTGIDITTEQGAQARAVFEGQVMNILVSPISGNKTVLIQHGNYITIYSNLATLSVKQGEKVSIKQNIGRVATSPASGTVIKFSLYEDNKLVNPSPWIAK